jgi:uncharacterized protein
MATDLTPLSITERADGVEFNIKVVPGASRDRIVGLLGTALKVAVAAAPEGGQANATAIKLLAQVLDVKRTAVTITHGHTQPHKRVAVRGATAAQVHAALEQLLA